MLINAINSLRSISLIWKLLIPFLVFSFLGITAVVYIGFKSQQELIEKEERKEILKFYRLFLAKIKHKEDQALSMASIISQMPEVRRLLAKRDRDGLVKSLSPLYHHLKRRFKIQQFHFHVPPGKSFLRLHLEPKEGEMIAYRKTIIEAMRARKGVAGLEWGIAGLGVRGVAPVFHKEKLAGSVEIGHPFDRVFLEGLKRNWGPDFTVYEKKDRDTYTLLATTREGIKPILPSIYAAKQREESPLILIAPPRHQDRSILIGPIKDYLGEEVALVEVNMGRSEILERLSENRNLMVFTGLIGILVSFFLIWVVAALFTRPISEIVREAREIAEGKRESRLGSRPADEIGVLTDSLNTMLNSLKDRRNLLQEYAKNLERKVQERTVDLVSSEEKYRTLVENLPLTVYRVLEDGTTEFINPYFTEKLGYNSEEVVGDRHFWINKIYGVDRPGDYGIWDLCWKDSGGLRAERLVKGKDGEQFTFIDQIIPFRDDHGRVKWIDGIMLDITELKDLQERAMRTGQIRILGEITARYAHEIRNPLATVGGFARRLHHSLSEDDPNRKFTRIIMEEVTKLEDILRIMFSSIQPVDLDISEVDMDTLLRSLLKRLDVRAKDKGIQVVESLGPSIPNIPGDEAMLLRAFESLLTHAIISMPEGERLFLSMSTEYKKLLITISHRSEWLSDEDIDQFFSPHYIPGDAGMAVLDLPLSKIIVHRHDGKIEVFMQDENTLVLKIELPLRDAGKDIHSQPAVYSEE